MAGNNVTLTFAGDSKKLESTFDRVGGASESMGRKVKDAGDGFDRVGEQADQLDTKAMGFRDTLTGVQDGMEGFQKASKGDFGIETFLLMGFAVGDLASGMYNLLIPAMKSAVTWFKATRVGMLAQAAASKIAAAAQWIWNIAMMASPIGLAIILIAALVAAIVWIAVKTDWFQRAWKSVWGGIVAYIKWVAGNYRKAFELISAAGTWLWNKIKAVGRGIRGVFTGIAAALAGPFRAAFNGIARLWNSTIGRLSWTVPGWVPRVGGASISAPKIPVLHSGGMMPGLPGSEGLALLQAGERVTAAGQSPAGGTVIEIRSAGTRMDDLLVEILIRAIRQRPDLRAAIGSAHA